MTQVNFRIEDDIKNNAEQALKEMGLNMSTAITMPMTHFIQKPIWSV